MATISLQDVQNQLPHFVAEAEAGHEIIIERGGKPVARLGTLAEATQPRRRLGLGQSEFTFPENFDHLHSHEIATLFHSGH